MVSITSPFLIFSSGLTPWCVRVEVRYMMWRAMSRRPWMKVSDNIELLGRFRENILTIQAGRLRVSDRTR